MKRYEEKVSSLHTEQTYNSTRSQISSSLTKIITTFAFIIAMENGAKDDELLRDKIVKLLEKTKQKVGEVITSLYLNECIYWCEP